MSNERMYDGKPVGKLNVKDLPAAGEGTWSTVYEVSDDKVVKVFKNTEFADTFAYTLKCWHSLKTVWENGIPVPEPFEMVETEESFGIVMGRMHGGTVGAFLNQHPELVEEYAVRSAQLLKQINTTAVDDPDIKDARDPWREMVEVVDKYLTPERKKTMLDFVDRIPVRNTLVHGDFHTNNIMLEDGKFVLIDTDEMGVGHPIMDLANLYAAYIFVATEVPDYCREITGMSAEDALKYWDVFLQEYLGIHDHEEIVQASRNIRAFALIRKARGLVFTDYGDRSVVGAVLDDFFGRMETVELVP